jgi:protein gp37
MKDTLIGWCHHTINFWWGCTGNWRECAGCYAREFVQKKGDNFSVLRLKRSPWLEAELLNADAEKRNTHELVFTCSMSDFFHEDADNWRDEAWDVIRRCRNLIWLILTKRPERIIEHLPEDWDEGQIYPHVWLGTTCGVRESFKRIDELRKVPCALRFLSCEPLLEDLAGINLTDIGWVLCGGMSGKECWEKHEMDIRHAASLYEASKSAKVPFLFKQMSAPRTENGINGLGLFLAMQRGKPVDPESECIREYPGNGPNMEHPSPKGRRWTSRQLREYCAKPNIDIKVPISRARKREQTFQTPGSTNATQSGQHSSDGIGTQE